MSTPFSINSTVIKEMFQIHKVYVSILQAYRSTLLAMADSEKGKLNLDQPQVERYIQAIKYYLNHQYATYDENVSRRQSSVNEARKKEEALLQAANQKIELDFNELAEQDEDNAFKEETEMFRYKIPSIISERSTLDCKRQLKLNENSKHQEKEKIQSDEESDDDDNYVERAEMQTTYQIFGNFSRNGIKRQVKTSKIVLYLNDMFVKCYANGRDAYFQQGFIELKHIEKDDAKLI